MAQPVATMIVRMQGRLHKVAARDIALPVVTTAAAACMKGAQTSSY